MSDVLDSVTRWRCAEWWHYTAALRITRSPENPSVIKFAWSEYAVVSCCAELGWMWRDVSRLCKERWQMTSIHHNPALSPAPGPATNTGIINSYEATTDNEALTSHNKRLWREERRSLTNVIPGSCVTCCVAWSGPGPASPSLMGRERDQKAINPGWDEERSWYQTCDRSSGDHYNIIRISSITQSQYTLHSTHQPAWHNTNNHHTPRIYDHQGGDNKL